MSVTTAVSFPQLCSPSSVRLTLWCRSLLFNGKGYTVYNNSSGEIVFRVDNYAHDWREEAVLMDFAGNVLLTVRRRRKRLSIRETWEAYKGDQEVMEGAHRPLFTATKAFGFPSCIVSVRSRDEFTSTSYRVSWSRHNQWFKIYKATEGTQPVAEVSRKYGALHDTLLGKDVLNLKVEPGVDLTIVMGMVMIIDSMR